MEGSTTHTHKEYRSFCGNRQDDRVIHIHQSLAFTSVARITATSSKVDRPPSTVHTSVHVIVISHNLPDLVTQTVSSYTHHYLSPVIIIIIIVRHLTVSSADFVFS